MDTFVATTDAVGGSVALSALVALLPFAAFFILLLAVKAPAWVAAVGAVVVAAAVAIFGYHMPAGLVGLSGLMGAVYGLVPIVWIIFMAIWLYQITVRSGRYDDLRGVFDVIGGGDVRIQAILVAFCFGGLLEALAGFGAPVAITATMLLALGIPPLKAAATVLVANTAPVAFGAVGIPITTAGNIIDPANGAEAARQIGAIVGHQSPILALFVPTLLAFILDGTKGLKDCWVVTVFIGVVFAVAQFLSSNYFSYELTDIVASLVALAAAVVLLRFYRPRNREAARARLVGAAVGGAAATAGAGEQGRDEGPSRPELTASRVWMALFPYLLVIVVFAVSKLWKFGADIPAWLASTDVKIKWPGLYGHLLTPDGAPSPSAVYTFQWLSNPGSLIFITAVLVAIVYTVFTERGRYRLGMGEAFAELGRVVYNARYAALTIVLVLALAYIMNFSGQTVAIGTWMAAAGGFFAFLSPVLGWIGTFVTGSDTSSNALFAKLQATAATNIGVDPHLLVAANTSGGVVGKLISPQNLALAATTVGMAGQESVILKKVIGWSVAMLFVLCCIVFIEAQLLG